VSQTFTVAHRSLALAASAAAGAAAKRQMAATAAFGGYLIWTINTFGCALLRYELSVNAVTEPASHRRSGVNEAIVEPIVRLPAERSAGEQFEALYRRTFPRVYAYVASMLRDRTAA